MTEKLSALSKVPGPLRFLLGTAVVVVAAGFGLAMTSRKTSAAGGLQRGLLADGPSSPNWAGSETDAAHPRYVAPIAFDGDANEAWKQFTKVVQEAGGEMVANEDQYLHAVFTSAFFRFCDDVEARLDTEKNVIHLRSASRVGHSDFGANRQRLMHLHSVWTEQD